MNGYRLGCTGSLRPRIRREQPRAEGRRYESVGGVRFGVDLGVARFRVVADGAFEAAVADALVLRRAVFVADFAAVPFELDGVALAFERRGAELLRLPMGSASLTAFTAALAASPTVSTTFPAVLPAVFPTAPAVFPTVFTTSPG